MAADGSAPFIGEIPEAGGARPRTAHRGERVAGITLDGTRSAEMAMHNQAALDAQRLHNSGASASDGAGPVPGLDAPVSPGGSGVTGSGNTWADPSSLAD